MYIDTHCHVFSEYYDDIEEIDLSEVGKTRNITIRSVMEAEEKFK